LKIAILKPALYPIRVKHHCAIDSSDTVSNQS